MGSGNEVVFFKYEIKGTYTVGDKTYGRLYLCRENGEEKYLFGVREAEGQVLVHLSEYAESGAGLPYPAYAEDEVFPLELSADKDEAVLYDFNKQEGDILGTQQAYNYSVTDIEEIGLANGETRKLFRYGSDECYLEGIGCTNSLGGLTHYLSSLMLPPDGPRQTQLNLFVQNGEVLYKAPDYEGDPEKETDSYTTYRDDPFFGHLVSGIRTATTARKTIREGIYAPDGRRLPDVPQQGIYIRNGQKRLAH